MKKIFTLLLLGYTTATITAQTTHNISMGASYANAEYYNLSTDATTSVANTSWDIAFSVYGSTDAGVLINDAASLGGGVPIKAYVVPNKSFSDNITSADFGDQLRNPEVSWGEGAINTVKSPSNPFDYGWGVYNQSNHTVNGTNLFVIELRDGSYKKFQINSLSMGTYSFEYADLDGSNLQQKTIAKSAHAGKTLAHFSFATGNTVSAEPAGDWDWVTTRYESLVDNQGTPIPYNVGGILTNKGVKVAPAFGINPSTVDAANYTPDENKLDQIGYDWKAFSFSTGWEVPTDRVYFIVASDNNLYKIQFIDFQGSSTGRGTFQKTSLGQFTSVNKVPGSVLEGYNVYPNPATDLLNITFDLEEAQANMTLRLVDVLGRVVLEETIEGQQGLNGIELNVNQFATGNYFLNIQSDKVQLSQKVIIK